MEIVLPYQLCKASTPPDPCPCTFIYIILWMNARDGVTYSCHYSCSCPIFMTSSLLFAFWFVLASKRILSYHKSSHRWHRGNRYLCHRPSYWGCTDHSSRNGTDRHGTWPGTVLRYHRCVCKVRAMHFVSAHYYLQQTKGVKVVIKQKDSVCVCYIQPPQECERKKKRKTTE